MTSLTDMPADIVEAARKLCDDLILAWLAHHSREDAAEHAAKFLIECGQRDKWHPIETAPKDGTEILGVFSNDYGYQEKPTVYGPYTVRFRDGKWVSSWDGSEVIRSQTDFGTEYEDVMDPTHWQPIPAPPAKGS